MEFGSLMQSFGWLFVLLGTFIEGELTLLIACYAAYHGCLSPIKIGLFAWLGSYLGDATFFFLGRRIGSNFRRPDSWLGKRVDRLAAAAESYPVATILILRFQIAMRMFGCVTLGVSCIAHRRFLALNALACALWAVGISALCFAVAPFWDWFASAMGW